MDGKNCEYDVLDEQERSRTPVTPSAETPQNELDKMEAVLQAEVVESLGIKPRKEVNWNIKDIKNNYGWGGRVKFGAVVNKFHKLNKIDPERLEKLHAVQRIRKRQSIVAEGKDKNHDMLIEKYISVCAQQRILPEPLVIPKSATLNINLAHYGIGDPSAAALSAWYVCNFVQMKSHNIVLVVWGIWMPSTH